MPKRTGANHNDIEFPRGSFQEKAIEDMRTANQSPEVHLTDFYLRRAQIWALLAIAVELESLPKER